MYNIVYKGLWNTDTTICTFKIYKPKMFWCTFNCNKNTQSHILMSFVYLTKCYICYNEENPRATLFLGNDLEIKSK